MIKESIICFLEKQNPYQNAYTFFCLIILIISNEKFQVYSQLECKNLKCSICLSQKPTTTLEVGACPRALNSIIDIIFA